MRRLGSRVARFRRVNEDRKFVHHDALELPSEKVVLLTRLLVGQRATVLQLPVAEREKDKEKETERSQPVTALGCCGLCSMRPAASVTADWTASHSVHF
jgi:hypothetical protein